MTSSWQSIITLIPSCLQYFPTCMCTVNIGMLSSGFGHVVNMSSIGGKMGTYRGSSYSAAKFGLNGMMDALRHEVECTCVCA